MSTLHVDPATVIVFDPQDEYERIVEAMYASPVEDVGCTGMSLTQETITPLLDRGISCLYLGSKQVADLCQSMALSGDSTYIHELGGLYPTYKTFHQRQEVRIMVIEAQTINAGADYLGLAEMFGGGMVGIYSSVNGTPLADIIRDEIRKYEIRMQGAK